MFIVSVGNLWDGFAVYGPFDNHENAYDWAQSNIKENWHIIEVKTPH
jgi:hypothetical protein